MLGAAGGGGELWFAVRFLPKSFRKSIDRVNVRILVESLSLIGKLFEIYFVRLIGTPNQNSKNGISFGWCRLVVHESLGS